MINLQHVQNLVGGKICRIDYEKRDGSHRVMSGRFGVHKYVTGTGEPVPTHLITVFDMNVPTSRAKRGDYRRLQMDRIQRIKCGNCDFS